MLNQATMNAYTISTKVESVPNGLVMWVDIDIIDEDGRPVWAFSDGPVGQRLGSYLFDTFKEGVESFPGYSFIIEA